MDMDCLFSPITLSKAKIVYNFGLSECNRVKPIAVRKDIIVYTNLAFLSVIGLSLLQSERP